MLVVLNFADQCVSVSRVEDLVRRPEHCQKPWPWLFLNSKVHYISCLLGLIFPTLLNSPMVRSIAGKVISGHRFNATQEVKNGGVWKDSTFCRKIFGVKHRNRNQETHQRTQWKMQWKHCGAIVGVGHFFLVVGSLLRSVFWKGTEWLCVMVEVLGFGIGLGCEGVSVPLQWGNSTSCIYLQTAGRAVGHCNSMAASSCPGWWWLVL